MQTNSQLKSTVSQKLMLAMLIILVAAVTANAGINAFVSWKTYIHSTSGQQQCLQGLDS